MAVADPYKALGVAKNASEGEIKKAYRKLAREFHPDRNPGNAQAENRFKQVQSAYDTLSDKEKRKAYDRGGAFGGIPFGGGGGGGGGGFAGVGDMFSDLFGAATRGRPRAQRGHDLETEVRIGFDQSIAGTKVTVSVPRTDLCDTCHGSGAAPGTAPKTCPKCAGRGVESQGQGLFSISHPCSTCGGSGSVIERPCATCRGGGQVKRVKRYKVSIPPGVKEGSRIRLSGKGETGENGGAAGDLFVITRVAPSKVFKRKGDNLEVEVPITVVEAMRGGTIEVPTLEGTKQIRVQPGTTHGSVTRLRNEGPAKLKGGGHGDLHYRLAIVVPETLTKEQAEAVDDLATVLTDNPRADLLARASRG